jgi:hypothetical protein
MTKRPPFELIREYPYTVGALLATLILLTILTGINAAAVAGNSGRIDQLQRQAAAQQQQADTDRKNSAVFIKTFLDAQLAECTAILDADHRLGATSADPKVCIVAIPTPTAGAKK